MELFDALEAALGKLPIIAEDLGELFPSVRKLLADSTFPGMKVLQFAFGGGDSSISPTTRQEQHSLPGTHDNTTLSDWWENAATRRRLTPPLISDPCKPTTRKSGRRQAGRRPHRARCSRAALGSVADRAIIPMADWLGLGEEAHLNSPGKLGGNWSWRARGGLRPEPSGQPYPG